MHCGLSCAGRARGCCSTVGVGSICVAHFLLSVDIISSIDIAVTDVCGCIAPPSLHSSGRARSGLPWPRRMHRFPHRHRNASPGPSELESSEVRGCQLRIRASGNEQRTAAPRSSAKPTSCSTVHYSTVEVLTARSEATATHEHGEFGGAGPCEVRTRQCAACFVCASCEVVGHTVQLNSGCGDLFLYRSIPCSAALQYTTTLGTLQRDRARFDVGACHPQHSASSSHRVQTVGHRCRWCSVRRRRRIWRLPVQPRSPRYQRVARARGAPTRAHTWSSQVAGSGAGSHTSARSARQRFADNAQAPITPTELHIKPVACRRCVPA